MKRRPHSSHENHERWLISYADFITLLFAFFVVMFASSNADKAKAQQMSEAVREAFENSSMASILTGAGGGKGRGHEQIRTPGASPAAAQASSQPSRMVELLPSLERLKQDLSQEISSGKIQVSLTARGLVVSLKEAAFFSSGEDHLQESSLPSIVKVAQVIRTLPNPMRFEGHTDSIPIHNSRFQSNWQLSAARAITMLTLMESHFGIERSRMAVAGYADTVPVESNETDAGRAKNRRVDIIVLNQSGLRDEPARN